MKTTPVQYAKALLEATEHKNEQETNDVIARFAKRLRSDGQSSRLAAISSAFSVLWNTAHGVTDAQVTSREQLDEAALTTLKQFIAKRYGSKEVIITNIIDPSIGGGVVIRVGDELIDGSVATQLKKLKNNLAGK
ncbi:MAG: hypothetical protein ACD_81C00211G0006 [uncultured bacterium]|uniref:ATP synthase subunit delta n=1 Tax=Candidatus Wolfebacteria bacterium GW2011_GWE2_44_13 TaxID=1619017 RepID=A0A0G1JI08_9BACT|nr:MAG: hypothetical protein ACD_81C00211G0006 [uncultured bacterium]KKT43602.1 MAG: ATP synthase subunit delta [Candidatus Wolfebacteria bacterium GW2011_GWE2_44_13]